MPVEEALKHRTVLLVAAHPDDETIGAGGWLGRMERVVFVHVTDGAPRNPADAQAAGYVRREDYAAARDRELHNALEVAGLGHALMRPLCIVDQESSLHMEAIARSLAAIIRETRPGAVLTHPYEGGHPDHDATAFAVHAACALLPAPPSIVEFASYHSTQSDGAPQIETGRFLGDPGEAFPLTEAERERKRRMLDCFASQADMLRHFAVDLERFRPAPAYDFIQAPHAGPLFYENFDWAMRGERWRELAAQAAQALGIPKTL